MRSCIKMVKLQCLREWGLRRDGGPGPMGNACHPRAIFGVKRVGQEGGVARSYYIMKHKIVDI